MNIDPSWAVLGRTDNATIYSVAQRILAVAPDAGCTDDEHTARQSIEFQRSHWVDQRSRGAAVIFMDRVGHQTKGARRVYQTEVDVAVITAFALVGGSVFGRAVASVFMGLTRPPVPTQMFASATSALKWVAARNAEGHDG